MKYCILILFAMLTLEAGFAQKVKSKDYYAAIKSYDLSRLWCADSFLVLDADYQDDAGQFHTGPGMSRFPEPFGIIGNDYQRFYIHYIAVAQSGKNPYVYNVAGKSRVKDNICSFKGTITVTGAKLYTESESPDYKQGTVSCTYKFYEDSSQQHSGVFAGRLTTDFMLDKKGKIMYDVLWLVADGYRNNQCTGTWKSYKGNLSKKCNWGDFRIPQSGDLDHGAGEFTVNPKYARNGWQNYMDTYSGGDSVKRAKAIAAEDAQWWK